MANIIIILIVIVLLGFALKGTFKHMKGESPCCGGGGGSIVLDIPDKKLDNPVLGKKVLKISGMHCEHCAKAVTEAINKIDGASAKVKLSETRQSYPMTVHLTRNSLKESSKMPDTES